MSGRARFPLAVHGTLAAAILALSTSQVADPAALVIMGGALAWAFVRTRRGLPPPRFVERLSGVASFLYLGFFLADLMIVSRNLLDASMRLLAFLTIVRVLGARTDRDRVQLLLISFLSVVAATASTTQIGFSLPLTAYIAAALWALMCRQSDLAGAAAGPRPADLARRSAAALSLGLVIFFLIPHVGTGYFRSGTRLRQEVSGFSGRIELGSINRIKKNHEIVMRVRLVGDEPAGVPIRWRGRTFDSFDGRGWSRTDQSVVWAPRRNRSFQIAEPTGLPQIEYEVFLEPIDTPFLFAVPDPVWLGTQHFRNLGREPGGGLRLNYLRRTRIRYRAVSALQSSLRLQGVLPGSGTDYPTAVRRRYLQLPPLRPGILRLASELAGTETDPYRIAETLERSLRSRYTYTLDVQDAGVSDPVARFLLEGAPGHCEYFATSMTILLRLKGIPARVVTGFQRGTYSDLHGIYLVRQSDAHSWVEAYFPGRGWVGFDPTPPEPVAPRMTLLARLIRGWEKLEVAWDTWIVGMDLNDQASVLVTIRDALAETSAGLARAGRALGRELWSLRGVAASLAALLLSIVAVLAARRLGPPLAERLRRPWSRGAAPAAADRLGELYRRFLGTLARRGIRRDRHQTPLEFAREAGRRSGMPAEVGELTELFCRARYGAEPPGQEQIRRAEQLIRRLRGSPSS